MHKRKEWRSARRCSSREHMAGRSARADAIRLAGISWQQILRLKRQAVRAPRARLASGRKDSFRDLADALRRFQLELEGPLRRVETLAEPQPESQARGGLSGHPALRAGIRWI